MMNITESLKFENAEHHLTHDDLNREYGEIGMTFKTLAAAKKHKAKTGLRFITKVVDYHSKDIAPTKELCDGKEKITGYEIKQGAKSFVKAYLVN